MSAIEKLRRGHDMPFAQIGMDVELAGRRGKLDGVNNRGMIDVIYSDGGKVHGHHPKDRMTYYSRAGVKRYP